MTTDTEKLSKIRDYCIENMKQMRGRHTGKVHTMDHHAYSSVKYIYGLIDGEGVADKVEDIIDDVRRLAT